MHEGSADLNAETITVSAYLPGEGPGQLASVPLDVVSRGPAELVLPEVTVRDERGMRLLDAGGSGDLIVDPAAGGGPLGSAAADRGARLFGITNVAFHAQRAMRESADLLGHPLPHLIIRIGLHESPRRWGGGHYRVAARSYDPPEPAPTEVSPDGEIHFGGGSGFLPGGSGDPYFAAPSHNLPIIYHEIGHHVCRHTADFRLNRLRPALGQTNKKIALDEGSADLFTAIMLGQPDIYRWHRSAIPTWDRRRRMLDPRWTMASFDGGRTDPHADGTVWASACWSARELVAEAGHGRARFDRMFLRGLVRSGQLAYAETGGGRSNQSGEVGGAERSSEALKRRRYVSWLLESMLEVDPELTDPVLAGMAAHGIRTGASNVELREAARAADNQHARNMAAGS